MCNVIVCEQMRQITKGKPLLWGGGLGNFQKYSCRAKTDGEKNCTSAPYCPDPVFGFKKSCTCHFNMHNLRDETISCLRKLPNPIPLQK